MIMKPLTFLLILLSAIILLNCQPEKKSIESPINDAEVAEEISQVWADYIEYANNGNLDGALSMMTDDYVNMQASNSTQYGVEETKEFLVEWLENNTSEIVDYSQIELFVHDDMAYEFCFLEQKITPEGQESVNVKSRCLSVFKKQEDGSWKFHRWMVQL